MAVHRLGLIAIGLAILYNIANISGEEEKEIKDLLVVGVFADNATVSWSNVVDAKNLTLTLKSNDSEEVFTVNGTSHFLTGLNLCSEYEITLKTTVSGVIWKGTTQFTSGLPRIKYVKAYMKDNMNAIFTWSKPDYQGKPGCSWVYVMEAHPTQKGKPRIQAQSTMFTYFTSFPIFDKIEYTVNVKAYYNDRNSEDTEFPGLLVHDSENAAPKGGEDFTEADLSDAESAIENLKVVTVTENRFDVKWENKKGIKHYEVTTVANGITEKYAIDKNRITLDNLEICTPYSISVETEKSNKQKSKNILQKTRPPIILDVNAVVQDDGSVLVSWTRPKHIPTKECNWRYLVSLEPKNSKNSKVKLEVESSEQSVTFSNVIDGVYTVNVKTFDGANKSLSSKKRPKIIISQGQREEL